VTEKACTKCGEMKAFLLFSPNKKTKDRLQSWCKACVATQTRSYGAQREAQRRLDPAYRTRQYTKQAEYRQKNRSKISALRRVDTIRRRITASQATPHWIDAEFERLVFAEAYALAETRGKLFGFSWHVDHVIPLRGKTVSGLHVSNNIQVIPAVANLRKSNKLLGAAW
jgi:hypothetical protein